MKYTVIALVGILASTNLTAQKAAGMANVFHGKVVFIESNPASQYRHQGTVECSMAAPDDFERMIYHMVEKKAKKESEEVPFDALIFRPGSGFCKADLVEFYRDPEKKRSRGRDDAVEEGFRKSETAAHNGVNLFVENTPTVDYKLLGKIELPQNFRTEKYEELLSEMVRASREAYPEMNGIVILPGSELRKADVIKIDM